MPRAPMPTKKRPHATPLPGMENRSIPELDNVAEEYADIRDQRMVLTTQESDLKKRALTLMHKYKKATYKHDGIEINVVPGEEDVKVRVKKAADSTAEIAASAS